MYPSSDLVFDSQGNLYGTADGGTGTGFCGGEAWGNGIGCGIVFRLTPNRDGTWTESYDPHFCGCARRCGSHRTGRSGRGRKFVWCKRLWRHRALHPGRRRIQSTLRMWCTLQTDSLGRRVDRNRDLQLLPRFRDSPGIRRAGSFSRARPRPWHELVRRRWRWRFLSN